MSSSFFGAEWRGGHMGTAAGASSSLLPSLLSDPQLRDPRCEDSLTLLMMRHRLEDDMMTRSSLDGPH